MDENNRASGHVTPVNIDWIVEWNEFDNYARLYNTLEKLPNQRRHILELAVFDSCSYAQIAEKLQISVNTVKTQIGRSYRFLREELDPKSIQLLFLLKSSGQEITKTQTKKEANTKKV